MSDLAAFLNARLDEDEAIARAAAGGSPRETDLAVGQFVGRFDPARVLREVEAKRQIVIAHPMRKTTWTKSGTCCNTCGPLIGTQDGPCPTLRALIVVYSDHADYDQACK